jgi:hypothetical protein
VIRRTIFVVIATLTVASLYYAVIYVTSGAANYVTSHGGTVSWPDGAASVVWQNASLADSDLDCLSKIRCLTVLHIEGNPKISDLGLQEIARNAEDLSILNLEGTSVTQGGVLQFINRFPRCDVWWQGRYWSTAQM